MSDPVAALNAQIARIRQLGQLPKNVAPEIARELEAEIKAQIAAGTDPDGNPWRPTKDGHKPLQNAAKSLSVAALGTRVVAILSGVEARHHLGAVRGKIARRILPSRKLNGRVVAAIKKVVERRARKIMGGAGG